MSTSYLLLGSNLGNRHIILHSAREEINRLAGTILAESPIYETEPWGFSHENNFLNQVLELDTCLLPKELLTTTQTIEKQLGRKSKGVKYEGRTIDIDILLFNHESINIPGLQIPHPRMQHRRFTLIPLSDLTPNYLHPQKGKTIKKMLMECTDELPVKKIDEVLQ